MYTGIEMFQAAVVLFMVVLILSSLGRGGGMMQIKWSIHFDLLHVHDDQAYFSAVIIYSDSIYIYSGSTLATVNVLTSPSHQRPPL